MNYCNTNVDLLLKVSSIIAILKVYFKNVILNISQMEVYFRHFN